MRSRDRRFCYAAGATFSDCESIGHRFQGHSARVDRKTGDVGVGPGSGLCRMDRDEMDRTLRGRRRFKDSGSGPPLNRSGLCTAGRAICPERVNTAGDIGEPNLLAWSERRLLLFEFERPKSLRRPRTLQLNC
jgi:hypothetical protein